ncbi:hypothetical protein [Streptomyces sp. XH2]|uniref:hypothetical protein n=1 Tax=Streptomyces sp. XH2 TaxID=3412483 RepID=UPI003C7C0A46
MAHMSASSKDITMPTRLPVRSGLVIMLLRRWSPFARVSPARGRRRAQHLVGGVPPQAFDPLSGPWVGREVTDGLGVPATQTDPGRLVKRAGRVCGPLRDR